MNPSQVTLVVEQTIFHRGGRAYIDNWTLGIDDQRIRQIGTFPLVFHGLQKSAKLIVDYCAAYDFSSYRTVARVEAQPGSLAERTEYHGDNLT